MDQETPFSSGSPVPPVKEKTNTAFIVLAVIVLAVATGTFGYIYGKSNGSRNTLTQFPDLRHDSRRPDSTSTTTVDQATTTVISVAWQKPAQIASLKLFVDNKDDISQTSTENDPFYIIDDEHSVTYYKVGRVTVGPLTGDVIFVKSENPAGFGMESYYFVIRPDDTTNKITYLSRYTPNSNYGIPAGMRADAVAENALVDIPDLNFPQQLHGSAPRQTISYVGTASFLGEKELNLIMVRAASDGLPAIFSSHVTGALYVRNDSPLVGVYQYKPDIINSRIPEITWNDGSANDQQYNFALAGGCGSMNYITVVPVEVLDPKKELIPAGKDSFGQPVYELKNKNHDWLKNVYRDYPTDPPMMYGEFLSHHPLVYWFDPFGRLVEMQNSRFASQAECGKPVIYLYPTKTSKVSVKVEPQGGMTYSEPPYNTGWDVIAEPNGALHMFGTNATYSFLFWEGKGNYYRQPKQGWVVTRAQVPGFLATKLAALGLNRHEAKDFMEYWVPRMREKPYYFITFMGNETMNIIAPLMVDPQPDTVIRILMDFQGIDAPKKVQPYPIHTPVRRGFTVVEWGGVIR